MFHQLMGNIWHNCLEQILVSLRKPGFRVQSFSRRHNLQGFWDCILPSFSSSLFSKLLLSFHYKQQSTHPERSITYHACCFMSCPILCVLWITSCFSHVQLFVTPWTVASRLLCPWYSPGKNTGVSCPALLPGIFPTQGSNPHLLCLLIGRQVLHWQCHLESPNNLSKDHN